MKNVVIALGSNVGDTLANLKEAIALLEENGCVVKAVSDLYQTEPWAMPIRMIFLTVRFWYPPTEIPLLFWN